MKSLVSSIETVLNANVNTGCDIYVIEMLYYDKTKKSHHYIYYLIKVQV